MDKKRIWSIVRIVIFATVLAVIFRSYLFASYVVNGKSMEPTLHDGNLLMVNKMVYDLMDIHRFDVIVFHANEQEDYVKRVVGKPGDHIEYRDDVLYVNGEAVEEPYLEPYRESGEILTKDFSLEVVTGEKVVPEGKLFVLGDNRTKSYDSREIGFVDQETVVGKVDIRYWPMSELNFQFIH
ncbi:signal peptidase I [Gracilibacillus caseinilyticus]|uniref:Signal peptidase I n=1 Tax=Gracilibacillus caseinilyticus TaxID=2932256 RepID=A0ABY4ER26_9BACI|nr:signal peptidase I [Gracilibacillus caseinilyticus]UOQ46881.1 signal peptidase I [Gracilibacillus caseinilyticus]